MQSLRTLYPLHLTPGGPPLTRKLLGPAFSERTRSILLMGCRYGENALALCESPDVHVSGIEEDSEAVLFAKMAAMESERTDRTRFLFMSPVKLDFPAETFDAVLMEGILSGYPWQAAMREAKRVLKPDGILGISDSIWLRDNPPSFIRDVWESPTQRIPTRDGLEKLFESFSMEILSFEQANDALTSFYKQFDSEVKDISRRKFDGFKHQKNLIRHYKHEIDVFSKHGGSKFMGYALVRAKRSGVVSENRPPEAAA